MIYTFTDMY